MNATITLRDYLNKGKIFVIPEYQRGYVWGKRKTGSQDSVSYMLDSLIEGFEAQKDVFIQGVTVSESDNEIILVDGQQRTTFFYLLLKFLSYSEKFQIDYKIGRKESKEFLASDTLLENIEENKNEDFQDIYFFKKTLRLISDKLNKDIDRKLFLEYVLDHVKFLYINILKEKAITVFTMMNGNKAEMKAEELIKAELLRLISLNDTGDATTMNREQYAAEWDNNMLRSRYAREWDKWLQWWNREDVKRLYKVDKVMGLLISTFQANNGSSTKGKGLSFDSFRGDFLKQQQPIEAKQTFDKLRRLQKRFEDAFNNAKIYNYVGAIIRILPNEKEKFINWYFCGEKPSENELERYYKLAFLGLTHKEIVENDSEAKERKFDQCYENLNDNNLYFNNWNEASHLLLRLNIDEDNRQEEGRGRRFDFSIWDNYDRGRSLEHIYPKSKVYHVVIDENGETIKKDGNDMVLSPDEIDKTYISRESCASGDVVASEHSIGNLVLLYKDDNSSFNNSSFEDKKAMFFKSPNGSNKKEVKLIFKSRHLLHTIYKFAASEWTGKEIAENKALTLKEFKKYYGKE
jgi:uncharacterized protein with ParB-like and HNH nuclease domain